MVVKDLPPAIEGTYEEMALTSFQCHCCGAFVGPSPVLASGGEPTGRWRPAAIWEVKITLVREIGYAAFKACGQECARNVYLVEGLRSVFDGAGVAARR